MFTFYLDLKHAYAGGGIQLFAVFFVLNWTMWLTKTLLARRTLAVGPVVLAPPSTVRVIVPVFSEQETLLARRTIAVGDRRAASHSMVTVIVPVFNEQESLFHKVLESIVSNEPAELIVVVDGGDPMLVAVAAEYATTVLPIPKSGKREAIARGLAVSDPNTAFIALVDSDTYWTPGTLDLMLEPFSDPRVGGVTPRQAIFDRERNAIRRFADWMEDQRFHLSVPAQSVFGAVGCLSGRTIAYRREAFEAAVPRMVAQKALGVKLEIGDDRVLTNELLRAGWRTVYQPMACVYTDTPGTWRGFVRQQVRWARSSQRETFLSLPWLWRYPFTLACFIHDIITPFWIYALMGLTVAHILGGTHTIAVGLPLWLQLSIAYLSATVSLGLRQIPHFRRFPRDRVRLPLFILRVTFLMPVLRITGFATMFHQSWRTRGKWAEEQDPAAAAAGAFELVSAEGRAGM